MIERAFLLSIARGDRPADRVLRGARIINVYTGEVETEPCDVAIAGEWIAGIGPVGSYQGREVVDLSGMLLSPGLIDAHVHIESSMCVPAEFARAVLPRGVSAVVVDPHEIANVAGAAGVEWMAQASARLPLTVIVMAPSCVPATHMARGGAELTASEIAGLRQRGVVHGLAEVMNFPGVISGNSEMLGKIQAMSGTPIDGHAPGVRGRGLSAYIAAGVGSDHECVTVEEAREKLARGMYLLIREATNAQNLDTLLPVVTAGNSRRVCFCTDDRTAGDLLRQGSIDMMVRRAMAFGIPPIEAIRMGSLNTAEWFHFTHLGGIAPGKLANLNVLSSLEGYRVEAVYARGERVHEGHEEEKWGDAGGDVSCISSWTHQASIHQASISWDQISLRVPAHTGYVRVIGVRADQLVTDSVVMRARVVEGGAEADVERDLLKMAVIGRHGGKQSGKGHAVGFIRGFGLNHGAIAGTVAHDHHNLVMVGCEDEAMRVAGRAVMEMGGGLAVVGERGEVLARLALPVGGLMSEAPVEQVAADYDRVISAARSLGSPLTDPLMAMSFMALEVIPSLKLTERGLVDVETFEIVDVCVEGDEGREDQR